MIKKYFWQILSAILFILLLITCKKTKDDKIIVVTPQKQGSFQSIKPEPIKVPKYIYKTLKGDTIELENPVNEELAYHYEELLKERDSIKLRLAYLDAIQIRKYKSEFEDKNLKVSVYSQTTGTLDSLSLDYVIKPDTIEVAVPKQSFALFLGGGTYSNSKDLRFKLNLGVQTKKGNVIIGGYDPLNKNVFLDYNFKIFSLNK